MDAVKYMKQTKKMCDFYMDREGCSKCPLNQYDICLSPCELNVKDIEISIEIVKHWSKTHKE